MEQLRELTVLVNSLRRSVEERAPTARSKFDTEQWRYALLALEEVRLILRQARRRMRDEATELEYIEEAHRRLLQLSTDDRFMGVMHLVPFLVTVVTPPDRERFDKYRKMPAYEGFMAALDLAARIATSIEQPSLGLSDGLVLSGLSRIVPEQKVSPAKFEIRGSRIALIKQSHSPLSLDNDNVSAARSHLAKDGRKIIDQLKSSNCDRRLIETLENLHTALVSSQNVIEIGLTNIGCETVCDAAREELPDAVSGMLKGYTANIGMFVAQFPEWQRFSENAASVDLSAADVEEISMAASQIIARIDNKPEIADDEVPKTIKAIRALVSDPAHATKRAAFALLRTVENFFATVFRFGADFVGDTAEKTSKAASTAISKVAVAGLMTVALAGASHMTGVSGKVTEAGWIKSAVEIVRRQLDDGG